jgi:hypothetical protein
MRAFPGWRIRGLRSLSWLRSLTPYDWGTPAAGRQLKSICASAYEPAVSVELLETAAGALGALRTRVVFLGGATIGIWMTDPAARAPRVTYDVDVVAEVVTLSGYETFQGELRRMGFSEDLESGVICRWLHAETGLTLDAVPAEPRLAGFLASCVGRSPCDL